MFYTNITNHLQKPANIAPLVVYRMIFGAMLLISSVRFLSLGWIKVQYIDTKLRFSYYGFEWVKPLNALGMYGLYVVLIISSICFILGYCYRLSAIVQFLVFTYIELIDKTYYLNHYYFVSLMSFLLIFLPCHAKFSIDSFTNRIQPLNSVPQWTIWIIKLQLGIVYFYAGICKINYDWLINAQPLSIWLPGKLAYIPMIGTLLNYKITAYIFSWFGMIYDLTIPLFLLYKPTRVWAFITVIIFHSLTSFLFPIGVFPLVMICSTTIYFSISFHEKIINWFSDYVQKFKLSCKKNTNQTKFFLHNYKIVHIILIIFLLFQMVFPFRYLFYPGDLFWTEQGFRFSWRVMLVEKVASARFIIHDPQTGFKGDVNNSEFLNEQQEKQMSYQPDMIIEYARFLGKHYHKKLGYRPKVTAEIYVSMNGKPRKLYIDPDIDLSLLQDNFRHKTWILPAP